MIVELLREEDCPFGGHHDWRKVATEATNPATYHFKCKHCDAHTTIEGNPYL